MAINQKDNSTAAAKGNTRKFVQENQKSLAVIGGAIIVLILLYIGYQKFYLANRETTAANQMYRAEQYAASDSTSDRAINGDGSFPGFETIAEKYSSTKSANLANAYLGGLYLRKGEFQKAIDALGNYSMTGSPVIDPLVLGMMGDAYSELKDLDKAITYYKKAADKASNDFTSPLFLKKLGLCYEAQNDYSSAVDVYKKIKEKYPQSTEGALVDEYIARSEAHLK